MKAVTKSRKLLEVLLQESEKQSVKEKGKDHEKMFNFTKHGTIFCYSIVAHCLVVAEILLLYTLDF